MIVATNIASLVRPFYPLQGQFRSSWIAPMNNLPRDQQIAVISALTEGCSIRSVERLTGIHRDTIMRLGVRVGNGCGAMHDAMMRGVDVSRIELDEAWSYISKKQAHLRPGDSPDFGDQYVFIALAGAAKAIRQLPGRQTHGREHTRIPGRSPRPRARCARNFLRCIPAVPAGCRVGIRHRLPLGTIDKEYAAPQAVEAARRYSPAAVVAVKRRRIVGRPEHISTSYVERQNLTLRMQQRRFTRLTNAFSKKLDNHVVAVALYVAHYNFCRVHEALRVTPAMQLGIANHIWTIGELVDAALEGVVPGPGGRRYGRFTVIEGGRD